MPLIQDDGTDVDSTALALMHQQSGGAVDRINYMVVDGLPVIIDGNTISTVPVR
jgi:hypothetical protein